MYKNPQLSATATALRKQLSSFGLALGHAQALEVAARLEGARTLHVAQARKKQPVNVLEAAKRQASDLMFESLGRFENNVDGLLSEIAAAFAQADMHGSRFVEAAMHDLFEQADSPKVAALFDDVYRLEQLPELFRQTVQRLSASLASAAQAPAPDAQASDTLFDGTVFDWRVTEGEALADLPEHHRTAYGLRIQRAVHQVYVDLAPHHQEPEELDGKPQMSLFIEVNEGLPCVHMTNTLYGDQVLTVFFTEDGLYLRPDDSNLSIRTGMAVGAFKRLEDDMLALFPVRHPHTMNNAFIPNSNA